jgi:hypothetical protein
MVEAAGKYSKAGKLAKTTENYRKVKFASG